ncbi:MAG TPA: hypothetical protein VGF94_13835 [Kofleriaceae bacterium]|jgi:hypothetical protein
MRQWWIAIAVAAACGGNKTQPPEQKPDPQAKPAPPAPAPPPTPPPPPPAAWTLPSHPVELSCGDKLLDLPAPKPAAKPAAPRKLARGAAIAGCHDLAAPSNVCGCLAKAKSAVCKLLPQSVPTLQIADVTSKPANPDTTSAGDALVVIAKHGTTWSPLGEIESSADIDLSVTPHMSGEATLLHVDEHALADGSLVWIETQSETVENSLGEHDHDGSASGTICIVPASAPGYCFASLELAKWTYSLDNQSEQCTVSTAATYAATVSATSATLRLEHGSDDDNAAGTYGLE